VQMCSGDCADVFGLLCRCVRLTVQMYSVYCADVFCFHRCTPHWSHNILTRNSTTVPVPSFAINCLEHSKSCANISDIQHVINLSVYLSFLMGFPPTNLQRLTLIAHT